MKSDSIQKLFLRLKEDYVSVFSEPEKQEEFNPIKIVNVLKRYAGIATERLTYLPARTTNGYCGIKEIYVNDETGEYEESISIRGNGDKRLFVNQGITTIRCGAMTAVAIDLINEVYKKDIKKVGFIGNGRTNLMNALFIKTIFEPDSFVIRGSHKDRSKNAELFNSVLPTEVDYTDDMRLLNKCDVVIVTTSNYEAEYMINADTLSKPKIIIVLDCGYTLDESFRNSCCSFTDYPVQMYHEYKDEFPLDNEEYIMHCLADYKRMNQDEMKKGRTCVYLHGIALADITTAEMLANKEISI